MPSQKIAKQITIGVLGAKGKLGRLVSEHLLRHELKPHLIEITHTPSSRVMFTQTVSSMDVVIDTMHGDALEEYLPLLLQHQIPLVIAATGQSEKMMKAIQTASQHIPLLLSRNFSHGIRLIKGLLKNLDASSIQKITLKESHQNTKKDAPSGTLLDLKKICPKVDIQVEVERTPHFSADHEVILTFPQETLIIKHHAHSRSVFAQGIIQAAFSLYRKL